jgi:hypothetical protein
MRMHRIAAVLAMALGSAWLLVATPILTDGDSCLYAAMSREIAETGNWAAPTWAHKGGVEFFRENPPGALWLGALFQKFATGFNATSAPHLSTLWWLGLLTAAIWRLAGGRRGSGALAVLALLLTLPVLKYSLRAGLEIPFAACVCAAVESLRARRRRGAILGGLFFGGALLTRGIFGFLVPLLWIADARVGHRRPMRRVLSAGVLGITLAFAFDLFHQLQGDGTGFWASYLHDQVLSSLQGTAPHPETGNTWSYYATRLGLYSLPWGILILWRLPNRLMRMRPEVPLCIWWIALVYVGAAIAHREGSRYLFAAWPAVALLFSALWREDFEARSKIWRTRLGSLVVLLIPCTLILGTLSQSIQKDSSWLQSSRQLSERSSYGWANDTPPVLYSTDFSSHDDRLKQFIRWHLNTWAFWSPDSSKEIGSPAWNVLANDLNQPLVPPNEYTFWCPLFEAHSL